MSVSMVRITEVSLDGNRISCRQPAQERADNMSVAAPRCGQVMWAQEVAAPTFRMEIQANKEAFHTGNILATSYEQILSDGNNLSASGDCIDLGDTERGS